jgi:hypothetical protein
MTTMSNNSDVIDNWGAAQQHTLAIVPKISAILSISASCWIVVEVFLSQKKHFVYHKLLGTMALWDILTTALGFFPTTWSQSSEETDKLQAYGNARSCTAQGFFVQLHMAGPVYLACLAVYFMLVITRSYNEEKLKRRHWEIIFHCIPLVIAGATAIASVSLKLIRGNAGVPWCWIHEEQHEYAYQFGFFFGPVWVCLVIMISAQMSVFQSVKIQEERMKKYLLQPGAVVDNMSTRIDGDSIISAEAAGSTTHSITSRSWWSCNCVSAVKHKIERIKKYIEHLPRTVEVVCQSLSYTCAFLLSNFFILVQYTYEHIHNTKAPFALVLLHVFLQPLQVSCYSLQILL